MAVDGKLYRDPVIEGDGWFLCFDDDDPPELVVKIGHNLPDLKCVRVLRAHARSGRCFSKTLDGDFLFEDAHSYWCELLSPIPVPKRHDGTVERDQIVQGVIYDPEG